MNALLVIDIQNDFLPGGSLAVPEGDDILPIVNELMPAYDLVIATQDWHPADHGSFACNHPDKEIGEEIDLNGLKQILWPAHCIQGSEGAQFPSELHTRHFDHIVRKGSDPTIDSYSGFFDNGHRKATGLTELLKGKEVTEVHLVGLATDYCLKFTALDALMEGFRVTLIQDACRGVNLNPNDVEETIIHLKNKGLEVQNSRKLLAVSNT